MKKLLPPKLFLLFALAMGPVCWALGSQHHILYPLNLSGLALLVLGIGIAKWGKTLFAKRKTNINTFDSPDLLITEGLYKYSRNPMYLGFAIAIFGVAILFQGAFSSFVFAFLFIFITDRWYIGFEEKVMREKFGQSYRDYCKNTRRWI